MAVAVTHTPGPRPGTESAVKAGAAVLAVAIVLATAVGANPVVLGVPVACLLILASIHRWLLQWRTLIALVFLVILFIPMKRYALLPGALPIKIEPYRVLIAMLACGWIGTLLIDPAMRLRRTGLEWPLLGFGLAVVASVAANVGRVSYLEVGDVVIKKLTFIASFVLMVYLVATVVTSRRDLDMLIRVLVLGGVVVTLFALYEGRSGVNYFDRLGTILPPLRLDQPVILNATDIYGRGGRLRVFASAEHPIALSATLAMLVPLGIYLAKRDGGWRWWIATGLLAVGVVSTVSRTGVLMLFVIGIAYTVIKPRDVWRALPMLVPLLVAMNLVVPGALGGLKSAFFPPGGLVAEQQYGAGQYGSGRLADLGPGLAEWRQRPVLGQGYGTRISDLDDPRQNAGILDNQWLGALLETGILGAGLLLWLFLRTIRRLGHMGRLDGSAHGWLLASLAASLAGFAAGMFTFDAFNFTQVTFLAFIFVGLAVAALRLDSPPGVR
jgi:O-Antigen ligase